MSLPTISIVIVNLNGRQFLLACIASLFEQAYPSDKVEIILVDNGSQDGSVEEIARSFPTVKILQNAENTGFAPAVNQGAVVATGDYLALLNNDARAEQGWLAAMVDTLQRHREQGVVCVGSVMLDWEGKRIDFAGSGLSYYGFGYQFLHHLPIDAVKLEEQEILFACGGAMLVERDKFLPLGGFDNDYFAYFEDIDFGWRLWVSGYRVMLAPQARVFHVHHGASRKVPQHQINLLLERNALVTIFKNYDDANLARVMGPSLLMMLHRMVAYTDTEAAHAIDWDTFRLHYPTDPAATISSTATSESMAIAPMSLSYIAAIREVMQQLPHIWQKRQQVQAQRNRPDNEILPLFHYPMGPHHCGESLHSHTMKEVFNLDALFAGIRMHRILIISTDPLYEKLAGPGIRALEMARHLAPYCSVVLAAPRQADVSVPGVTCVAFQYDDHRSLESLVNHAEVVILQGFTLNECPFIATMNKILVVDLYDPFHLENLEFFKQDELEHARALMSSNVEILNQQLKVGDFFICASERQRNLWLGALSSVGRLSPESYAKDPTFRALIDVVPFGIDPTPPVHTKQVLKGVVPGIASDDIVLLWGGGIWDWLDPITVIHAMHIVRQKRSDIKLFFMGAHHPNPVDVPKMKVYEQVMALVQELELEQTVFFNDRWVEYHERGNYFLEADIGISAHIAHIETYFAFRTRLLDYIWAGLPMIITKGDTLADIVQAEGLGYVTSTSHAKAFAEAILLMLDEGDPRQLRTDEFEYIRERFLWTETLKPLIAFCQNPHCAPDRTRQTLVDTYQRRMREMEETIAQKNSHIAYLESLLHKVESGRVMRLLNWAKGRMRK